MAEPRPIAMPFTAGDGYQWQYCRFLPCPNPRAEIVVLHGIQSHGKWYYASSQRLAEAGYGVSLLDRRGCGMNDRDRGDAPSFRRLLDDIAERVMPVSKTACPFDSSHGLSIATCVERPTPSGPSMTMSLP